MLQRSLGGDVTAYRTTGTTTVVHHQRLAQQFAQALAEPLIERIQPLLECGQVGSVALGVGRKLPAGAHHSHAMFDHTKFDTITGTVIDFAYVNPHGALDIAVMGKDGKMEKYWFERSNLSNMVSRGIFCDMNEGTEPGIPDGLKVDSLGRVYCTGPGGIWVMAPDGKRVGIIKFPEQSVNFAFGGPDMRTLFCCAHTSVYTLRVKVPGNPHPWYKLRK